MDSGNEVWIRSSEHTIYVESLTKLLESRFFWHNLLSETQNLFENFIINIYINTIIIYYK